MRVLCFGDSNTYGYDPHSYLGDRYPAESRWVDLLGIKCGWEMINAGVNGCEIPRRADELEAISRLISSCLPLHRMLIMTGSNDLLQGADVPVAIARLKTFLQSLPISAEKIVLIAPPPMQNGTWTHNTDLPIRSARYAAACRDLAVELGLFFADTRDWAVPVAYDGVHYTEEGNRIFAERLSGVLQAFSA